MARGVPTVHQRSGRRRPAVDGRCIRDGGGGGREGRRDGQAMGFRRLCETARFFIGAVSPPQLAILADADERVRTRSRRLLERADAIAAAAEVAAEFNGAISLAELLKSESLYRICRNVLDRRAAASLAALRQDAEAVERAQWHAQADARMAARFLE